MILHLDDRALTARVVAGGIVLVRWTEVADGSRMPMEIAFLSLSDLGLLACGASQGWAELPEHDQLLRRSWAARFLAGPLNPEGEPMEPSTARQLYEAYCASADWKNFRGEQCPPWEGLTDAVRKHWGAVVVAVSSPWPSGASMTFGQAIAALKAGKRVRRAGWNGKGMWLALTPTSYVAAHKLQHGAAKLLVEVEGVELADNVTIGGHVDMRAADGTLVIGWLASQTDMLAEDWQVLE